MNISKPFNKLSLLSLLALLGLISLTGNKGFLGFLGFLYYVKYFFVIPDELFKINVQRSASIGFFSGMALTSLAIIGHLLAPDYISPLMAFALFYIASVGIFTLSLLTFELKESWED